MMPENLHSDEERASILLDKFGEISPEQNHHLPRMTLHPLVKDNGDVERISDNPSKPGGLPD